MMTAVKPTPEELFEAIKACDAGRVKTLLDQGADPNAKLGAAGRPVLFDALTYDEWEDDGSYELTKLLVEKGADIEMREDRIDETPLMLAACGHGYTLKYLIEKGAVLDKKDSRGNTALDYARIMGNTDNQNILKAVLRLAEEKTAHEKRIVAWHDTAVKKQSALKKRRPKVILQP
jgi:ankyrin repeat protein